MTSITEELRDWAQSSFGGEHQVAARPYLQAVEAIADRIDAENATLRELAIAFADCRNTSCDDCIRWDYQNGRCSLDDVMRKLGMETDITPFVDRCKALVDSKVKALEDEIRELSFHEDMGR